MSAPADKPDPAAPAGVSAAVSAGLAGRMTRPEVAFMLAAAARRPAVFMAARARLETTLFERDELHLILLWRGLVAVAAAHRGEVPADPVSGRELVALACGREVAGDAARVYYTPTVEAAVLGDGGLVDATFAVPADEAVEQAGFDLLARFLTERVVSDPLRRALAGLQPGDTLADPAALLAALERHACDIAGVAADPGTAAVGTDDFCPRGAAVVTTKLPWLDEVMNGGHAADETYALLGVTGGGKSALAVAIALEGAELQNALAADLGPGEAGYWYYFTYELTTAQVRERVFAYGARVSRATLNTPDPVTRAVTYSTAADPATLKPYEHEPFVNSPGVPLTGEAERVAAFKARMGGRHDRLIVVDYSGSVAGQGTGGVPEVAAYLRREVSRGRRVAGYVVDYAGIAVQRHVAARNLKPEAQYPLLNGFVDQCRTRVSIPFHCPGWVLHQFHGDVTKRSAGAAMHHSEAAGARNFADNADFAIGWPMYSRATGLTTMKATKHRRAPGREDGVIVRFDGRFGTFTTPDQEFAVDPVTRQIVLKSDLDRLPVGPAAGRLPPPVDPRAV